MHCSQAWVCRWQFMPWCPEYVWAFEILFFTGKKWPRGSCMRGNCSITKGHSYPTDTFLLILRPSTEHSFSPSCELSKLELWLYFNYQITECNFAKKNWLVLLGLHWNWVGKAPSPHPEIFPLSFDFFWKSGQGKQSEVCKPVTQMAMPIVVRQPLVWECPLSLKKDKYGYSFKWLTCP